MKREIKFRAWDTLRKYYLRNACVDNYGNIYQLSLDEDKQWVEAIGRKDRYVLQQYTGLKDRNGKEIYEGDIVKWLELGWDQMCADIDRTATVEYQKCGFYPFNAIEKNMTFHENHDQGSLMVDLIGKEKGYYEFEVIGNIYEHPDLLKQP